jgi:hypothetical protein
MAAVTLDTLIDSVRRRADLQGSQFISDTEITEYLNGSLAELYGLIIDSFENYYVNIVQFDLASTDDGYTLPDNFFKELRVDRSYSGSPDVNGGDWIRLQRINIKDESNYNSTPLRSLYYPRIFGYLLYGTKLKIVPRSEVAGTYRMLYYPTYIDLSARTDEATQVGPAGQHWEEMAIIDAAMKCLIKEETEISPLMAQKQLVIDRIKKEASNRIAGDAEPPFVSGPRWYDRGFGHWTY